jgi:hypothetical protein
MNPRGRDQLTTMVGVDRLARPPHRIRGGQPGQHVAVVQDYFHQHILAHRPPRPCARPTGLPAAAHQRVRTSAVAAGAAAGAAVARDIIRPWRKSPWRVE